MSWYQEAVFYHIYPLGMTGAPKQNEYKAPEARLEKLLPWVDHIKEIGCNAIYIGPLFESVGHGYETTDYRKLDARLGTNKDLKKFVDKCHKNGIRVIFDGVFNHTGRDFFAFKDIQEKREASPYTGWYCNLNFGGNNEYNDGFSYDNWGGYNLLVKLNQKNPEVQNYICDVIRFWVEEFDLDGIRLDAADVLDFDIMRAMRRVAEEVKPDFWLMGEVIHGDYSRWVNGETLHSVTNYALHKALYSGHNDHNYFEIAHTVKYLQNMGKLNLYNFVDNHDVERIHTKLSNKAHFTPVHVLLYTLPGVPSIYYGSEFAIEGKKEKYSDDSLRPELHYEDYKNAIKENPATSLISVLGKTRQAVPALSYGSFTELMLTNRQYAFARDLDGVRVLITVNNDDNPADFYLQTLGADSYTGVVSGKTIEVNNGQLQVNVDANSGDIWVPTQLMKQIGAGKIVKIKKTAQKQAPKVQPEAEEQKPEEKQGVAKETKPVEEKKAKKAPQKKEPEKKPQEIKADFSKPYEEMSIEELQACILAKMAGNGPVDDQMKKTVYDNIWKDSLINWVKSFR